MARRTLIPAGAAWRVALVLSGLIGAVAIAGCGQAETGNFDRGRLLFVAKCGTCHTLAQAATAGTQGPDLDAAFAQARASGEDADTIAGVVKAQVSDPRPSNNNPSVSMPKDLVSGGDLDDVATYVSKVAGVPGIKPPPLGTPPQLFTSTCATCHTLKAVNASGTTGPDLDKVLPGMSVAQIKQSITDPNAKITSGYPAGVMPQTFAQLIPPAKLTALIKFLTQNAGK